MARPKGSKNKNKVKGSEITELLQQYWGNPQKIMKLNVRLADIIENGAHKDSIKAMEVVLKYIAVTADKEMEVESNAQNTRDKNEIIDAIHSIKYAKVNK